MDSNTSLIIGHRANTLDDIFHYYYKHDLRVVNLDVQLTQDKKIAIYNGDVSVKRMKNLMRDNILVLDEVLKNVPDDLTLNIEINRYECQHAKQNLLPNDIVTRIIMAVKKRGKKNVLYSSFDRDIVRILHKNGRDAMLLIKDEKELLELNIFPKICINKSLLPRINEIESKDIYVYDVVYDTELNSLKSLYPFIKGWIVDYDWKSKH